ncbi:MAG: DUF3619 family protein [Sideroxydans sp.]|nr:DUF3619 family protein [Sideroxydans sp.]
MNSKSVKINTTPIAQLLNRSAQQLDENTLSALRAARQTALTKQRVSIASAALSSGHQLHFHVSSRAQKWIITLLVAATLISAWGVLQHQHEQQINELDIAILSDEMPIEVFLD